MLLLSVTFMKFHSVLQLFDSVTAPHTSVNLSTKQVGTVFCESHFLSHCITSLLGGDAHFVQHSYWSVIHLYPDVRL
jgi:hypothetical protein